MTYTDREVPEWSCPGNHKPLWSQTLCWNCNEGKHPLGTCPHLTIVDSLTREEVIAK
jgi:hypothetical protein